MENLRKNSITVQGFITPVPAVEGSEQAGSRPSRYNYRNATPVESLAEVADRATSVEKKEAIIFKKSSKVRRSPPGTPLGRPIETIASPAVKSTQSSTRLISKDPAKSKEVEKTSSEALETAPEPQMSPREELISRARIAEEQSIQKCREVLNKMRAAFTKQKNISMDIKNGVSELDELLDVLENHRRSWKMAEKEHRVRYRMIDASIGKFQTTRDEKFGTPISGKRAASSPIEDDIGKKHKAEGQGGDWILVEKKANKKQDDKLSKAKDIGNQKPTRIKSRSDAVLIKPKEGHTYAEVLMNLRRNVKPEESNAQIRAMRKTKHGALLLELEKGEKINKKLTDAIRSALVNTAEAVELTPKTKIEIMDLDSCTTPEEITEAVNSLLREATEDIRVTISSPNSREQKRAVVSVSNESANILLRKEKIKVGWVNCRLRLYVGTNRCYKCLEIGHNQWICKGPDRKNRCLKCGETGHRIRECNNSPKCCLCLDKGLSLVEHIPGSRKCPASENQKN